MQNHVNVAPVGNVHAKDAAETDDVSNDDEHAESVWWA
jgi:hypothetical protein